MKNSNSMFITFNRCKSSTCNWKLYLLVRIISISFQFYKNANWKDNKIVHFNTKVQALNSIKTLLKYKTKFFI